MLSTEEPAYTFHPIAFGGALMAITSRELPLAALTDVTALGTPSSPRLFNQATWTK
jgi:hypothetical protein